MIDGTIDYEKLGAFYLGRKVDPASGAAVADEPILYDSRDLTTHAVCVGMTGSGKTGLCLALLEEAAIDGIPAICIDPKGDIGNLLLAFPALAPADFQRWVDPADAARKGLTVEALAAKTAETWKSGLAEWGQTPERIAKFRDAADVAIYTPGASNGLPLSILRSFAPPPPELLAEGGALRERVNSVVSGLFSLLGREADPLQSREHILLSTIFEHSWRAGASLDLAGLIAAIQKPPFDTVGAFDLETFFPAKERLQLAMAVNGLIAAPGFSAWTQGEPLDIQRLLFTAEGKPRIAIVSIAHLSDAERMFVVTLLLNEMVSWMRTQSGTSSLRALLYMDEIFGYFPPTANPPSKLPMLTLLKQARAFGVGCVLATQNPVDLDYKGLANTGTWFIGRLQTERDKLRVIEGLLGALADGGPDRETLERLMSGLTQRVFLMRNAHENAPVLFKSRWALSYLRGPMTGPEIAQVMASRKSSTAAGTAPASSGTTAAPKAAPAARPAMPAGIQEYFLPVVEGSGALLYKPMLLGTSKLHFIDSKYGIDQWQTASWLAPLGDDGEQALWNESQSSTDLKSRLTRAPAGDATFAQLPAPAMRAASYAAWSKTLASYLYESARASVFVASALKLTSQPNESEGDFRARLALKAREQRDAAVEELRRKYAPKLTSLEDRLRRADERTEREKSQLSQQKLQTALSLGATVLGALFGRKAVSVGTVGRATTAARSATRIGKESADVTRAEESHEVLAQRLADLQAEFAAESAKLGTSFDATSMPLSSATLTPRKSDIAVGEVALVWAPWRTGADGFPAPAWQLNSA